MYNTSRKFDCFNLAADLTELRNTAVYQQMRAEINRRSNPISGGTDWDKVHQLAEQIALGLGADLLTSAYFVAAASKTQGVSGLASGLELMLLVVSYSSELTQLPNEKVAEIINWAVTKVTPEMKKMVVTPGNVRDWYRCEYSCQKLFELITQKQPQQMPNLDALGYLIFEKIDLLETHTVGASMTLATNQAKAKKKSNRLFLLVSSFLVLSTGLMSSYLSIIYHDPVSGYLPSWLYQAPEPEPEPEPEPTLAQRIDQVFNAPVEASAVALYPEQVSLLLELDKNYQRFTHARTSMANLSRLSRDLPRSSARVKQESLSIAQYASSLSPILGRTYYIDDLLVAKEFGRADIELGLLNNQIKALLIKRTMLTQQLKNNTLPESDITQVAVSDQSSTEHANTATANTATENNANSGTDSASLN